MSAGRLFDALSSVRAGGHALTKWTVYIGENRRATIGTKDRVTGGPHAPLTISQSLAARYRLVWDDGRVSRGTLERRAIEHEPEAALAAARAASYDDPDATEVLGPADFPEVAMHDRATAAIAGGAVDVLAPRLAAVRARVAERGIRTWSGSMHAALGSARVVSSAGLDVAASGTLAGWSVTLDGEIGAGLGARTLEPMDEFEGRLDRLIAYALALREPAAPRTGGIRPVLLHPDVVEDYALGVLLHNLDGVQVAHGTGAFRKEQFGSGAAVFREDLSLRIDPLVAMAAGAYRFSQEGVPARACAYVERGRLASPLLDLKYARRLGREPTAFPAASDTVFLEASRTLAYEDALAAASGGGLVLSVLGVHTQDFSSGDFSLSAPQTLAIGPAGPAGRFRATISGNLFALLRSPEMALVRFPGEHIPGLLVPCRLDPA